MGATGTGKVGGGEGGGTLTSKTKQPDGFDFDKFSYYEQIKKVEELQNAMGQTGYEAGDPTASPYNKLYVNTGKSMCINKYLNTDGESIQSDYTDWDDLISKEWVKGAIEKLDKGMKPLPENIKGYKYMSPEALGKLLNLNISEKNIEKFIDKLDADESYRQKLDQILQNTDYTHKAYTSISYLPSLSTYDSYPVRLNVVMTKGAKAIVTNNNAEHEIVGGRNAKYNFTSGHVEKVYSHAAGKYIKQLLIDVYI